MFRAHYLVYLDWDLETDVVRGFEEPDAIGPPAGTGALNRAVTVDGANRVLILNLEWSPETTLQAEDLCHRPGQTREVHGDYLRPSPTVDEQMYDLVVRRESGVI